MESCEKEGMKLYEALQKIPTGQSLALQSQVEDFGNFRLKLKLKLKLALSLNWESEDNCHT